MCFVKYCFLFLCLFILKSHSLTCRTDGGPKESELKNIYTKCLKMQDGKNSSNDRNLSDQDWKESRSRIQRYNSDRTRKGNDDRSQNNNQENEYNRRSYADDRSNDRNNRNDRIGNNDRKNRHDMSNRDDRSDNDRMNTRNDFQTNEFGRDMSQYNGYHSSTQTSGRYKRERRVENSGKRSQYNPNTQNSYEDTSSSDENSSENNTNNTRDGKACALHCFLENLQMIGNDGMPDKYLVNHVLTKDVKNEDLKDFLQESIEECFQILSNENIEEKCGFSKSLLMCLSEKGKANCDDWKDDLKF